MTVGAQRALLLQPGPLPGIADGDREWVPPPGIAARLAAVERAVAALIDTARYPFVREISGHLHRAGGKRLRPTLLLMAAGPDADEERVIRGAAGVELLHLATLYHDDVMDRANLRRDRPSANGLWGNRAATLAGTYLFSLALAALSPLGAEANLHASEAALALRQGQSLECERAHDPDIGAPRYFDVIGGKTASLFALACRLGAMQGSTGDAEALARFGRNVGLAFQILDDVQDMTMSGAASGKPGKSDLTDGIYTLPTIFCLERQDLYGRALRGLLARGRLSAPEIDAAIALIGDSGALSRARGTVATLAEEAIVDLRHVDPEIRAGLSALAGWIAAQALPQ